MHVDDLIIIVSYCDLEAREIDQHNPSIVHVNAENKIASITNNELSV